jgi:pimeloyl-ACP methyl ester carboxylesterase
LATENVLSSDGTRIGYRVVGDGPGVVIVHGNASSSEDFAAVAQVLSDQFTVYSVDRRGRGLSGPQGAQYSIQRECDDIETVLERTRSPFLFAHSYGALVALELVRSRSCTGLRRLALYEPPLFARDKLEKLMPSFRAAMASGDHTRAYLELVTGLEVLHGFSPQQFEWYLDNQLRPSPDWPRIVQLMEATEKEAVEASSFSLGSWELRATPEIMLVVGDESPEFIRDSADYLIEHLPQVKVSVLHGQGHMAQTESPQLLAGVLKRFFGAGE